MSDNVAETIPRDLVIKLQHTVCSCACPEYSLSIHGDGRVIFKGKRYVFSKGKHEIRISVQSVKLLLEEIYKADFFSLKEKYDPIVKGGFVIKLSIHMNGKIKEVINCFPSQAPESLYELEDMIKDLTGSKQFILGRSGQPVLKP